VGGTRDLYALRLLNKSAEWRFNIKKSIVFSNIKKKLQYRRHRKYNNLIKKKKASVELKINSNICVEASERERKKYKKK
jgi:hypothetical protein